MLDRLPTELCLHIFSLGQFLPHQLHALGHQLTKADTPWTQIARSDTVWRTWASQDDLACRTQVPLHEAFARRWAQKERPTQRLLCRLSSSRQDAQLALDCLERWADECADDLDVAHAVCARQPAIFSRFDDTVRSEPSLAVHVFDGGRGARWMPPSDLLTLHDHAKKHDTGLAAKVAAHDIWSPWSPQHVIDAAAGPEALFEGFVARWRKFDRDWQECLTHNWRVGKSVERDPVMAENFTITAAEHEFFDFDAALALCLVAPQCLQEVTPTFREDRNFVLQVMRAGGGRFFEFVSALFSDDENICLAAVSFWGKSLEKCSTRVRRLPQVARAAYCQDESAAAYIAPELLEDESWVRELWNIRPSEILASFLPLPLREALLTQQATAL